MKNRRARAAIGGLIVAAVVAIAFITNDSGDDSVPAAASADEAVATDDRSAGNTQADDPVSPSRTAPAPTQATPADLPDLPDRGLHPELVAIDGWLQSDVNSLEELEGQVVAVQFWTFGCSNCMATLPHMQELYEKYHDQGFEIVGVHAPEFSFEADVGNITQAAADLGVTWPIVLDTEKRTFHLWQEGPTGHWPRVYLLDRDGHIRYDHIGEGRYDETDAAVQALLDEPA
jgi:thiol-disulfide isomerase/thioredoxin